MLVRAHFRPAHNLPAFFRRSHVRRLTPATTQGAPSITRGRPPFGPERLAPASGASLREFGLTGFCSGTTSFKTRA